MLSCTPGPWCALQTTIANFNDDALKSSHRALKQKSGEAKPEALKTPFASEMVYTNAHRNDHLLKQLSKKTFFKMFTSIQISATNMAKPAASSTCLEVDQF